MSLNQEYEVGAMDTGHKRVVMRGQLEAVEAQAECIRVMRKYLRAKVAWQEGGERGAEPAFCGAATGGIPKPVSARKRVA